MKAFVYRHYGPAAQVLRLEETPLPTPGADQVLVKVRAAGLNSADWRMMQASPFLIRLGAGLFRPKVFTSPGSDVAGVVVAVGANVRKLKPGDEVFGSLFKSRFGALAEYKCAFESELTIKPAHISFEEAAALPTVSITGISAVKQAGEVKPGQRVLIYGASGGVGSMLIQLVKLRGAHVTAVCSGARMEQALSLGADQAIDYTKEDFSSTGQTYDFIFGVNGGRSLFDYRRALKTNGMFLHVGGDMSQLVYTVFFGKLLGLWGPQMKFVSAIEGPEALEEVRKLAEQGNLRPVIAQRFPFSRSIDAVTAVESGHAGGKIVVVMQ